MFKKKCNCRSELYYKTQIIEDITTFILSHIEIGEDGDLYNKSKILLDYLKTL